MTLDEMKPFGSVAACPKCRAPDVTFKREFGGAITAETAAKLNTDEMPERLLVRCVCGHCWYERCADAEETGRQ